MPASGRKILHMFTSAADWLEESRDAVDAINVFPVPDGDTGTNMLSTLRAAVAAASPLSADPAGSGSSPAASAVAAAMARGAFENARGNGGIILSQLLRGLALALEGKSSCGGGDLRRAFQNADGLARSCIASPVEGTILTVYTDVSRALATFTDGHAVPLAEAMGVAMEAARRTVASTPSLMPLLEEAGVVDAGAKGVLLILEGAHRALTGGGPGLSREAGGGERAARPRPRDPGEPRQPAGGRQGSGAPVRSGGTVEYCTAFLLEGEKLPLAAIRERLVEEGTSVIVAGDETAVRVHIHTCQPEALLAYAGTLGKVSHLDMHDLRRARAASGGRIGLLAFAPGAGIAEVCRSLGAEPVATSGAGPDPDRVTHALLASSQDELILLPFDAETLQEGRRVAASCHKTAVVIAARSVPQCIAALVAFRPGEDLETNVRLMNAARAGVRSVVVDWTPGNVLAEDGVEATGALDGEPSRGNGGPAAVVEELLGRVDAEALETVVVYYADGVGEAVLAEAREAIRRRAPQAQVEQMAGGQPRPRLIISLE